MVKPQAFTDRWNTLHSSAKASEPEPLACGSTADPKLQQPTPLAQSHNRHQQPQDHQDLPVSQQHHGVPVYVMLPLDTVSQGALLVQHTHVF